MNIKTAILAGAAALTLALPAAALAQPAYGYGSSYSHRDDYRRDDYRRVDRDREIRRAEEQRRLRWEREHNRYGYGASYYR